jgi:transcriptional regulator with XRE-family HTH domain
MYLFRYANEENCQRVLASSKSTPIAKRIAKHLLENRVSQTEFADQLGVDPGFVSRIMSGTRHFGPRQIPQLAFLLREREEDVALLLAGYDPVAYREQILHEAEQPMSNT